MHGLTSTFPWNINQPKDTDVPDASSANSKDLTSDAELHVTDSDSNACYESVNPEMALDERDLEGWEDVESDASETGYGNGGDDSDDCEEMYE